MESGGQRVMVTSSLTKLLCFADQRSNGQTSAAVFSLFANMPSNDEKGCSDGCGDVGFWKSLATGRKLATTGGEL